MISKYMKISPMYGFISKKMKKFYDYKLFPSPKESFYTISKIKIWYGTPKDIENIKKKIILGIQCEYVDIYTENKITSDFYCGELSNDDIEQYEIELKNNDYIHKIHFNFELFFTYIKILTKKGKCIECGEYDEIYNKFVGKNCESKTHMVNSFSGFYNNDGLKALGFRYISRTYFKFIGMSIILKLKHILKTNEEERKKWENPENLKKLSLKMKAIIKLCNLEGNLFNRIFQYYFPY